MEKNNHRQNLDIGGCRFVEIKFYPPLFILPENNDLEIIKAKILEEFAQGC